MLDQRKTETKYIFYLIIGAGIFLKLYLCLGLPRFIYGHAVHDDSLLLNYANGLLTHNWLGAYSNLALNKMPGYAFFLALSSTLHVPYTLLLECLNIFAVFVSMKAVDKLLDKPVCKVIWFYWFLFNPVFFDAEISQRLYRNAVIPALVLLVIFSFIGLYLRKSENGKIFLGWALLAGISTSAFWMIREDSIWMGPFIIVATIVIVIAIFAERAGIRYKWKRIVAAALPLLILVSSLNMLKAVNYHFYHIYTLTDFNSTSFAYAIKNIFSVKPEQEKPYIWVSRDTMEKLYTVSPTLASLKGAIDLQYNGAWQTIGKLPDDGEIEKDYIVWAIRDSVALAGYYQDAQVANDLYKKIGEEIEAGFEQGLLEKRDGLALSSLARPIDFGNFGQWVECESESLRWTIGYEKCSSKIVQSTEPLKIRLAEEITRDVLIYPDENETPPNRTSLAKMGEETAVRTNAVIKVYQIVGMPLFIAASAGFIIAILYEICNWKRKKKLYNFEVLICTLGTLLSILILHLIVSINYFDAWNRSTRYGYLGGSYPLQQAYIALSLTMGYQIIKKIHKEREKNDEANHTDSML